ncbi:hypothetical protein [Burkholderia sp. PU8-34]
MVVPGMGIQRNRDGRMMVMQMMRVMLDIAIRAAQHLGHRRRDHAQQDGKHPEVSPDLQAAAEHGGEIKRRFK